MSFLRRPGGRDKGTEINFNAPEAPESFGQFLQRERELRDISLEEIASYTRIKLRALQAIEEDDFGSLPPLAFIRAFIRCYADYLGLDVNDVMVRFEVFVQKRYPELTGEVTLIQKKKLPRQRFIPIVAALGVVLLVAVVYWVSRGVPQPPPKQPTEELALTGPGSENGEKPGEDETEENTEGRPSSAALLPTESEEHRREERREPPPLDSGDLSSPEESTPPTDAHPRAAFTPSPWFSSYPQPIGPSRKDAVFPLSTAAWAETPAAETPTESTSPAASPLRVELRIKAPCFTRYFLDDNPAVSLTLNPGPPVVFEAERRLKIELSNPDGIETVIYNGRPIDYRPTCYPWWLYFPPSPTDNHCPHLNR